MKRLILNINYNTIIKQKCKFYDREDKKYLEENVSNALFVKKCILN